MMTKQEVYDYAISILLLDYLADSYPEQTDNIERQLTQMADSLDPSDLYRVMMEVERLDEELDKGETFNDFSKK